MPPQPPLLHSASMEIFPKVKVSYLPAFFGANKLGSYVFLKMGMVTDASNANTWEAKVGLSEVQGQPEPGQAKL